MQSNFGTAFLWAIPSGALNPVIFAAQQGLSADFAFDLKKLYGQHSFPLEQGRGKATLDLKSSVGRIDATLFNTVFFGMSIAAGEILGSVGEAVTVPSPSGPYTITAANGATFKTNLGVYNPATGRMLTQVASGPITGQYSVNTTTGVYTFAAADAGLALKLYYTYGSASTGQTITGTNPIMDSGPVFGITAVQKFRSKTLTMVFPAVQSSKLTHPFKQDDFLLPEMEMSAQDDGLGNVFTYTVTG